jgi:hypothetical protein
LMIAILTQLKHPLWAVISNGKLGMSLIRLVLIGFRSRSNCGQSIRVLVKHI